MFTSTSTGRPHLRHRQRHTDQHPNPSDQLIAQYMFFWSIRDFLAPRPRRRRRRSHLEWAVRATEADKARTARTVATDILPWLTIQVSRHYRHPGAWVCQAPPMIETLILYSQDLEDAKVEAERLVRVSLELALCRLRT